MNFARFEPPTRAEELSVDLYSQGLESAWLFFSSENALDFYRGGESVDFNEAVEMRLALGDDAYDHPRLINFLTGRSIGEVADQIGFGLRKQFESDWSDSYDPYQDRPENY